MQAELTRERIEFLRNDYQRGFSRFCGFQVAKMAKGSLESVVTITEHHRTQDNFIHAGVIATMSDHTAGYAAYTLVPEHVRILTVEFKVNFFKPAYGNALNCRAEVISHGRQILVAQATVFDIRDRAEKMVSRSTVTLMAVAADRLTPRNHT
jgi:uncharacterized protein (TIGR00369 family)